MSINLVRPSYFGLATMLPSFELTSLLPSPPLPSLFAPFQDEELRLYTTPAERELYDSLATLFSIVVSLDYLERAYVRDSITSKE